MSSCLIAKKLSKDIIFSVLEATQRAAIASYDWIGKADNKAADAAAVGAMRDIFNKIDFKGCVVIGEGERDKAPMLYIGEKVGTGIEGSVEIDIAVDPLECTNICAEAGYGSISVATITQKGGLLHAPDLYMQKIAIAKYEDKNIIDIEKPIANNLKNLAKVKGCEVSDLLVTVLKRDRHNNLIKDIRDAGAKVKLIGDGDICAIMELDKGYTDMYVGIGGAPEGVIAASILKCLGGEMYGKLLYNTGEDRSRCFNMGIDNLDKIYSIDDMVRSSPVFIATAVTDNNLFKGVIRNEAGYLTNSIVISPDFNHEITSLTKV